MVYICIYSGLHMSLGIVSTFLFLLGYMSTAMIFPLVTIHGNKC
jgi:hypothetical protein